MWALIRSPWFPTTVRKRVTTISSVVEQLATVQVSWSKTPSDLQTGEVMGINTDDLVTMDLLVGVIMGYIMQQVNILSSESAELSLDEGLEGLK